MGDGDGSDLNTMHPCVRLPKNKQLKKKSTGGVYVPNFNSLTVCLPFAQGPRMSGLSQAAGFLASFKIQDLFFFLTSNATLQKKTSLIELIGMISKY